MLVHEKLGIFRVRLPLPFRLNHINCYAVKGSYGWWIVDTGLNTEQSRQGWQEFFREQGIKFADIRGIYLTHYHPDHFGSAGWLQELSGAPVFISEIDAQAAHRFWVTGEQAMAAVPEMFAQLGMPKALNTPVVEEMSRLIPFTRPHPTLTPLQPGSLVQLGDYFYRVVPTPGHSDGHVCFHNQECGVLFSGDHLLPKITSNISLWPQGEPDPLQKFLQSLKENLELRCQTVFPAHGQPFANVDERIEQLQAHHAERLGLMREATANAAAVEGATVFEVCKQVFSQELSLHEMRFAMSETYAHLMHMVYQNIIEVREKDGVLYFTTL